MNGLPESNEDWVLEMYYVRHLPVMQVALWFSTLQSCLAVHGLRATQGFRHLLLMQAWLVGHSELSRQPTAAPLQYRRDDSRGPHRNDEKKTHVL